MDCGCVPVLCRLGLADPDLLAHLRDRIAEFGCVLAICCTLARIGNEVYELRRPEIGELREPTTSETVGSIHHAHKRNPEGSEHLDTLSRLARANAAVLIEGMVVGHERDGRGWKAEWVALPEICMLTGVSLQLARHLLSGLSVEVDGCAATCRRGDNLASEQILAAGRNSVNTPPSSSCTSSSLLVAETSTTWSAPWWRRVPRPQRRVAPGRREAWATQVGWSTPSRPAVGAPARESEGGCVSPKGRSRNSSHATHPHASPGSRPSDGAALREADDLTGFGVAGNKARPLEYLMGAAVESGADVLVAAGSPSSNFCAAAALAAATVGLDCDLLFPGTLPTPSVNVELARAAGARVIFGVVETRERARRRRPRPRECPAC